MTATTKAGSAYRSDIQGIRAIGALLVACFHIWGGRVSGGVDVFFVISGFLITGSLYKEVNRSQTIDVLAFWGRIAKRVIPMGILVLLFTFLAILFLMPPLEQGEFLSEIVYSALHLENLKLMMTSVDYLARDNPPSPTQQFWALSVQVQFYAVWPFLLLCAAFVARKARSAWAVYALALTFVFLASLAYSIVQTAREPSPTYFNTLARVWEFAIGGLIAVAVPHLNIPSKVRFVAGWIGLLAIVSCGFVVPASAHFPGYVALWPVMGASLLLVSGSSGMRFGADRLLSAKPLAFMGDFSFAFYLWHWPILIFAMLVTGETELSLIQGLSVIAIALCCAYLSHRGVEEPIQAMGLGKRFNRFQMIGAALVLPVLMAAAAGIAIQARSDDAPATITIEEYRKLPLQPPLEKAMRDAPQINLEGCNQSQAQVELIACTYGNKANPTKTIALVGDSHSAHWFPALHILAEQNDWRLVVMTKDGCPPMAYDRLHATCREWTETLVEELLKLKPDAVFTTSTRPNRGRLRDKSETTTNAGKKEYVPPEFLEYWARFEDSGITFVAIRDTPRLIINTPRCLNGAPSQGINCGRPRSEILDDRDPSTRLGSRPANVKFIDLNDQFCTRTMCPSVLNNMIMYRDGSHLTATYARHLAPLLGERMEKVRPDLFLSPSERKSSERQVTHAAE